MPRAATRHITSPYPVATVPLAERYRELLQAHLEAEGAMTARQRSPLSGTGSARGSPRPRLPASTRAGSPPLAAARSKQSSWAVFRMLKDSG